MLWYISSISSILIISIQAHAIADAALNAACDQNPSLPQCLSKNKAMGATTTSLEEKTGDEKERFRQAAADRVCNHYYPKQILIPLQQPISFYTDSF